MTAPVSGAPLMLTDAQRLSWLRLIRSENVGPATFRDLINKFGSARAALEALPDLAARSGGRRPIRIATIEEAEAEMEGVARMGARILGIGESGYPPMLRHMDVPPPLVTLKGSADIFAMPAVSIVGARNASAAGARVARQLSGEIGRHGYAIVSGLARGIDAAAHWASLDTGTVAVLAGGIDKPYPPENLDLLDKIAERGAIISEMPLGWEPRARDFPRRNRLIAGLGLGLVVVEAAHRSGSLISARLAGEMGRLVFAVPGSPLDPRAAGSNALLKDGAIFTVSSDDVIEQLRPMVGSDPRIMLREAGATGTTALPAFDPDILDPSPSDGDRLLTALSPVPTSVDDLIRHSGLHPSQVLTLLLELDLAGRIERHSGGAVSLVAPVAADL